MTTALASDRRPVPARVAVPVGAAVAVSWALLVVVPHHGSVASFGAMWLAMCAAMMIPTVTRPMLRAAQGSVAGAGGFSAGFLIVWWIAGVPAYLVVESIEWTPAWIAIAWVIAGLYQLSPLMQRNAGCSGVRFDGRALAYGARQGTRCVVSCWPVMVASLVTFMLLPGQLLPVLAMLALTVLLCWEKAPRTSARMIAAVGVAMLLMGSVVFVTAGGGGSTHHSAGASTS